MRLAIIDEEALSCSHDDVNLLLVNVTILPCKLEGFFQKFFFDARIVGVNVELNEEE